MTDGLERASTDENDDRTADRTGSARRVPVCFVVDEDASIRRFLSLILHGAGLDTKEFADSKAFVQAIASNNPELVFLNVSLEASEAIEAILKLAKRGYFGFVQLMSTRGAAVLEHVKSVGDQHRLQMLPVLKKPFDTAAIVRIMQQLKLGHPTAVAARIELDEALSSNWIEFWYQPKIDLRRKQLAGAEAFARARHPQFGVLSPNAFMPGAAESELMALAELALISALKAALNFSKLGINLRFAVNIPVNALVKLPIPDIVRAHRPASDNWAGLIIDLTEEQIVTDLALAAAMAKKLKPVNVKLAIDHFGRSYAALTRLKELPFSELKLDRFAIGIEKAPDALALTSMGCDMGQGFLLGQPMPEERFMSLLRQRAASQARATATR